MRRLLQRFLPFILTLTVGVTAHQFVSRKSESLPTKYSAVVAFKPISNIYLPEADFPEQVKYLPNVYYGSLRLKALFDSDGRVKHIAPTPNLPYGVPETAAGKGEFLDYTPYMAHSKFVKELPFGLTQMAIGQIQRAKFSPATSYGKPVGQWVMINVEFSYSERSRFASGCSRIDVTVMDDSDVRWNGNTWSHRDLGCTVI